MTGGYTSHYTNEDWYFKHTLHTTQTTTHHDYTLQRTINTNNHSATHDGARSDDNRPNADSMTARQHDSGGRDKKQHPTTPAQCAKKIEQRGVGREREMETGGQANRQEHTSE